MLNADSHVFKVATEPWEFEQIHRLNYQTFVVEIPQHERNDACILIDNFHQQNTYVICALKKEVVGMVALRDKRPLSLDGKLENLESYLPPFNSILEYRLLAVKKEHRNTAIFSGIMKKAFNMALDKKYDIAVISGTTGRIRLYRHLGFRPFGPLVGKKEALYQPMFIDISRAIKLKKESLLLKADGIDNNVTIQWKREPGSK